MDALRAGKVVARTPRLTEALVVAASIIVFDVALSFLLPPLTRGSPEALWRLAGVRLLETALLAVYWRFRVGGLSTLGLDVPGLKRGLAVALAGCALLGIVAACLEAGFRLLGGVSFLGAMAAQGRAPTLPFLVAGVVSGPLFEEMLFRGLLYTSLRNRAGVILSTLLVTAFFAAAHLPSSQVSPVQVVGGIFFALSLEYSRSLLAPVVIHMCGNAAIFLLPLYFS